MVFCKIEKGLSLSVNRGKQGTFYPEPDKWRPDVLVSEIFSDLPAIRAGGGNTSSCQIRPYRGKWLYEAGIKNDKIPVDVASGEAKYQTGS